MGWLDVIPVIALTVFVLFVVSEKLLENYVSDYLNQSEMTGFTQALLEQTDKILVQAKEKIHEANRSPHEFCSSNDLRFIRNIIYSSGYITDLGRMKNERLECSVLLGKDTPQLNVYARGILRHDDSVIFGDTPLFSSFNRAVILSVDNTNLVFNPGLLSSFDRPDYSYSVYAGAPTLNTIVRLFHHPEDNNIDTPDNIIHSKTWHENNKYFSKLCSQVSYICVVTAVDNLLLQKKHRLIDAVFTVLGLLTGGLAALLILRYFHKEQTLTTQLQHAIARYELDVYYQPIVNVKTGKIIAFEALIRWEIRPDDYVPADVLIDLAEKGGFITDITCYVLTRVKADMAQILQEHQELRVNINIAACDLQHDIFYETLARFQNKGIHPHQIGIELTERSAVDCHTFKGIERLRGLGHKVYLDDFGTGYSSLALLGEIQVDALKIDKAFTQTIGTDALTVSIVPQIISIAKKYKLGIVVEGVETEVQVAYFKAQPLPITAQGWFFGKPQNINDVYRLMGIKSKKKKKQAF
ncbi:EAL domain-containing protein [Paenochrobactrum pullorum]|uniref:EAL domain-containing protein n=1 Tax=Paenochrobactrum pullorum TaxID=1324351 RepID=UPI0035BBF928